MKDHHRISPFIIFAILILTVILVSLSIAAPIPSPDMGKRIWNLKNVDIITVINELSKETGKSFVVSPQVIGKVTFISSYPLTTEELYQAFLGLLETSGFVAIPSGKIIKIVPQEYIKEESTKIANPGQPSSGGEMAVTIARVKYVSAAELVKVLKQLVFHFGYIEAYTPTNDIIISDFSSNITRLLQLIHRLDKPTATSIEVIHLRYAQSSDIVKMVSSLLQQKGESASSLLFAADDRSNDVLLRGGTSEQHLQVRTLISQLDVPLNKKGITTEVICLKYLRAEKVAVIMNSLIESYKEEKNVKNDSSQNELSSNTLFTDQSNQAAPPATTPNVMGTGSAAIQNNAQFGGATNNNPSVDFSSMAQKQARSGSLSRSVQWEESTNAVIISAPADQLAKLKKIIKKLDVRRPQVLIEAVIAEVEEDRANELGIELNLGGRVQLLTRFDTTLPLSGIGSNNQIGISNPATPNIAGQGLSGAYFAGNKLRFLLRALEQDTRSNILSTPNIVTLDNEPAQIKVGQKISFSIGQIQNNPTGGNPFNYFNQQDVGLILTINPQITSDGSIKLIIEQELSNVLPGQVSAGNNPNLSERFIHTTVMAKDGDLLVLGGLIQNEWQDVSSKVPLLGDLPLFGIFFRNHEKQLTKQNLMIFLRPTILYDDAITEPIVRNKYETMRQEELKTIEPGREAPIRAPIMPPREAKLDLPVPFEAQY